MHAGVAEGLDFQASDGAEMADVVGEQHLMVFEGSCGDQGVGCVEAIARRVQHANLELVHKIACRLQLCG